MAIELRVLRCALALAEHRSFSRASKALHLSQPALSHSIRKLELIVGTQLFERGTDGVIPTDAGQIFLVHAKEVVARESDLIREMDLVRGLDTGELHVGSGTYPSAMIVDRSVARLLREHPKIRLRIQTENYMNLLPLLRKRELDLAVVAVAGLSEDPEFHVTALQPHQAYFVVRKGHPLLRSKLKLPLQQILKFPLVTTSRITGHLLKGFLADAPESDMDQTAARSFPAIGCESVGMMKTIAAESDAVTILPLNTVVSGIQAGQLVALPLVVPLTRVAFGVVRLAHRRLSPLGETFVRILQQVDAELLEFEQKTAAKLFGSQKRSRR